MAPLHRLRGGVRGALSARVSRRDVGGLRPQQARSQPVEKPKPKAVAAGQGASYAEMYPEVQPKANLREFFLPDIAFLPPVVARRRLDPRRPPPATVSLNPIDFVCRDPLTQTTSSRLPRTAPVPKYAKWVDPVKPTPAFDQINKIMKERIMVIDGAIMGTAEVQAQRG